MLSLSKKSIRNRRETLKKRAKKKGFDFDLTTEFLKVLIKNSNKNCPLCGIEYENKQNCRREATIDRINSNRGYTQDNVRVICAKCNNVVINKRARKGTGGPRPKKHLEQGIREQLKIAKKKTNLNSNEIIFKALIRFNLTSHAKKSFGG